MKKISYAILVAMLFSTAAAADVSVGFIQTDNDFSRKVSIGDKLKSSNLEYSLHYSNELKLAGERAKLRGSIDLNPEDKISPFAFFSTGYDSILDIKNSQDGGIGFSYLMSDNDKIKHKLSYALVFRLADSQFKPSWRYKFTLHGTGLSGFYSWVANELDATTKLKLADFFSLKHGFYTNGTQSDYTLSAGLDFEI